MNNNYGIKWQNSRYNILEIHFWADANWNDILEANTRALEIISSGSQAVVLFNDSHQYTVDHVDIGTIKDLLFNRLPRVPKNLRGVIILVSPAQKIMLETGIDTIANMKYGRKFMQVVDSYKTANALMEEKLRARG